MAVPPRPSAPQPAAHSDASATAVTAPGATKKRNRTRKDVTRDASLAAALIVAHNQARRIAATVRAARAIPGVDLVLVVDDGSTDNTQDLARKAGAVVVRHSHYRGRTVAMETGASVIAMRDDPAREPRAVLMLQGSLGNYAIGAAPLVQAVTEHVADLAIALTDTRRRSPGVAAKLARRAVEKTANWVPEQPLSRIRCMSREALEAAMPLARGAGLEVGMTLDVLQAGLTVTEVDCEIRHKPHTGADRSAASRATQYRDVMMAVSTRRVRAGLTSTRSAVGARLRRAPTEEN
ncbi:MAG: glycosyl transferase family 2 [Actinobacteria bacterium HGW-Actinobacteria-4]|nr:MAG: glycosyl transferase family 2 [Actinobacteria bacterium HGW-Actinobacteria-4]